MAGYDIWRTSSSKEFVRKSMEFEYFGIHHAHNIQKVGVLREGFFKAFKSRQSFCYLGICNKEFFKHVCEFARKLYPLSLVIIRSAMLTITWSRSLIGAYKSMSVEKGALGQIRRLTHIYGKYGVPLHIVSIVFEYFSRAFRNGSIRRMF